MKKDDHTQQVGEIGNRLISPEGNRLTLPRFRLTPGITEAEARDMLLQCYEWTVNDRDRNFVLDRDTSRHIAATAQWLTSETDSTFGLILAGYKGNGKTTMMYALQKLVNELSGRYRAFAHMGDYFRPALRIVHAREVVSLCLDDKAEYRRLFDRDMLGIDDVGTEPKEVEQYRNVLEPLVDLIEHRYQRRKFTVISTNMPFSIWTDKEGIRHVNDTMEGRYGPRMADRLNEMCRRITFANPSYRQLS